MMTKEEFFQWLETCPAHRWEITADEFEFVVVHFPVTEDDEEDFHHETT